jgi:hypothetical protein
VVPQRYGRQGEGGGSQWLGLMDRRSYALTLSKGGRSEHFLGNCLRHVLSRIRRLEVI